MAAAKQFVQGVYRRIFAIKKCGLPGCDRDCYVDEYGGYQHDYCGRSHAKQHAEIRRQRYYQTPQYQSYWYTSSSPPSTGPILFYKRGDPYFQFTNFYEAPIIIGDDQWPTTEHYFQAQKFVGTPYVECIRGLSRPREAFDFVRMPSVSRWRRSDWEDVKVHVMKKALLAKFSQHPDLCILLRSTKKRKLVEHSPYDSFWGDGGDGKGRNELGKLLMEIRAKLQDASRSVNSTKNKKEQQSPKNVCNNDSPINVADYDLHKNIPDSNKFPSNSEQSSSSPSSSEYSTPPTDPILTSTERREGADQDHQEQEVMDTDCIDRTNNEVPVGDLIDLDSALPTPKTPQNVWPPENAPQLTQLQSAPSFPQFNPSAQPSNSPQQRTAPPGFASRQQDHLDHQNSREALELAYQTNLAHTGMSIESGGRTAPVQDSQPPLSTKQPNQDSQPSDVEPMQL